MKPEQDLINPSDENLDSNNLDDMGLFDHLRELRVRLIYSAIAIGVCSVLAFLVSSEIFALLTAPFFESFTDYPLIGTGPADAFLLKLKTAFFSGVVLSSPVLCSQIWLFISPGLYEHEKKMAIPFVFATTFLFLLGLSFAYLVVVPFAFDFFKNEYISIGVTPTIRISEFLALTLRVLLGFGLVFEVPVLAYFLGRLGLITDEFLIKYFRHSVVIMFVMSAILTPPDVLTQCLMAGPLILLYTISIYIVRLTGKKHSEEED